MIVLLGLASLISLVASLVLGIRLLRLASRTRGVPELAMGTGFLLGGFLGLLCILVSNAAPHAGLPPETGERLFRIGMSLVAVGISCTFVFVWQTFRSGSAMARNLSLFGIACIGASLWPVWALPVEGAMASPANYAGDAVRLACMVWGCVEALRYHATMRRRSKLGLADPVVTNRFLLWGIAMAAGAGTVVMSAYMMMSGLVDPDAWPFLVLAILTTISPIAQWLAFFPPRAYGAWITRRAVAAAG